jgi:phosphoheptose isomerase (EC 5.3.1.-)
MIDLVINSFRESADVKLAFVEMYAERLLEVGKIIANALKEGNKVLLFGNGGSAADAQHIAAEIVGRFKKERRALPAIALTTDTSILTAVGNDYDLKRSLKDSGGPVLCPGI